MSLSSAKMSALRYMQYMGGTIEIDLNEGWTAVCAALACINMAKDGLCSHASIEDNIAEFSITAFGAAHLRNTIN